MKISLLIPPTIFQENSYGTLKSLSNPQPSIGLAYIAAVLEREGYEVRVIDAYVSSYWLDEILEKLEGSDILGISVLSSCADAAYAVCREVRSRFPEMAIIHGNLHPSLFREEVLLNNYADYIVHHEGEITFLELCNYISGLSRIEEDEIRGVSYLKNGKVINNITRPFMEDLDSLPFPSWHLYDLSKYSTDPRTQVVPFAKELQLLATRGCPNECSFCSSRSEKSQGQKYRMRQPKNIIKEIQYFYEKLEVTVFNFMDLAFPLAKKHAMEFCQLLIDSGLNEKIKWVSELRVRPLDKELVSMLKKSGCARVCFGIESGNNEILKSIKKGFTRDDVFKAVNLCYEAGLEVDGMFMLGLPGETPDTLKDTIQFAIDLDVRFAIFNLFVPYPGCTLYEELKAQDKIHFNNWSDFISYPTYSDKQPVYVPDCLSKKELMQYQAKAMRQFYVRPKFIMRQLKGFRLRYLPHYLSGLKGLLFTR